MNKIILILKCTLSIIPRGLCDWIVLKLTLKKKKVSQCWKIKNKIHLFHNQSSHWIKNLHIKKIYIDFLAQSNSNFCLTLSVHALQMIFCSLFISFSCYRSNLNEAIFLHPSVCFVLCEIFFFLSLHSNHCCAESRLRRPLISTLPSARTGLIFNHRYLPCNGIVMTRRNTVISCLTETI